MSEDGKLIRLEVKHPILVTYEILVGTPDRPGEVLLFAKGL